MGGAGTPQAEQKKQPLLLGRDFVFAFGPADHALSAHYHVRGKRPLPESPVHSTCEPYELFGRHSRIAGRAPQDGALTDGSTLSREPLISWPPARVPTDAGHPLPFHVAGGERSLPKQDR